MGADLFAELLERAPAPRPEAGQDRAEMTLRAVLPELAQHGIAPLPTLTMQDALRTLEGLCAEIDLRLSEQLNLILHHPDFQALEATWRGLHHLVRNTEIGSELKIKLIDISKRELGRTLRKYRGIAWDQSPIFHKVYEEEYGQFGGEPFGVLVGDYHFDHRPEDVQVLSDMAMIAAAAHVPFICAAAPSVMHLDSWAELANPRDLTRIFATPEYAAWRSLREAEDSRYLGLCLPRFLVRLPYGSRTDPVEAFAFEEDVEAADASRYLWANAAYAMATNITRAFALYGWCTRIRGVDGGGTVEDLPVLPFATADGATDLRCPVEVALSERREAELARGGFIPLVHRKQSEMPSFISAQSLQKPAEYDDPAASANAVLSARLPYLFASSRFAHYLKCMVRDKIGSTKSMMDLSLWLTEWITSYVDGAPDTSSEDWKASHPLEEARVTIEPNPADPGRYEAKFFLRPHYQLEGLTVALRLVSRVPAQ